MFRKFARNVEGMMSEKKLMSDWTAAYTLIVMKALKCLYVYVF